MRPSKENCQKAIDLFGKLHFLKTQADDTVFIAEFLEAAKRKLPSDVAIERDRKRSRKDHKVPA